MIALSGQCGKLSVPSAPAINLAGTSVDWVLCVTVLTAGSGQDFALNNVHVFVRK